METKTLISTSVILLAITFGLVYAFPWRNVNWGTISFKPSEVITVTGYAESQEGNREASFTAGVSAVNDDKQKAVDEVNTKTAEIVKQVKEFGIADTDIKTQNISIYQNQEPYTNDTGASKSRLGQWNVSNNIEIKIKDATKVTAFSDLLASTGANQVYGPNYTTGDSREAQKKLLPEAIKNAQSKAEEMAKATGKTVGTVLSVTESGASGGGYPVPMMDRAMSGGGGFSAEPGTTTIGQSVTVTFELK